MLTCELNLSWQTLQETCFLFAVVGRPRVWWRTAFCTGSIWRGGERRTERPINTAPTLTCDRLICFHFIRAGHDQLISLFAHAGHTSTLRQHVCQGAVSTRRRQRVVLAPMRRPSKRMSFGYATWKIINVLVKNCQLY